MIKILVDTREQSNFHILKRLNEQDIMWCATTLDFGDYSFTAVMEDGLEKDFSKIVAVERKANLTEIAGNFCKGRNRFELEFCKGKTLGCKMVLMIEDDKAKEKMKLRKAMDEAQMDKETRHRKTWRSDFTANSMINSISAFKERYDLDIIFCKKTASADELLKIFNKILEAYKKDLEVQDG